MKIFLRNKSWEVFLGLREIRKMCQGLEIRVPGSEDRDGGGQAGRESQCRERCWWLDSVHKGEDGAERGAKEVEPY